MDSVAFSPVSFCDSSVSGSDFGLPSQGGHDDESTDLKVDFAALISLLAGEPNVEMVDGVSSVSVTPVDESVSSAPSGDQAETDKSNSPLVVAIPWTITISQIAMDISFVSANEETRSLSEGSATELPREEDQSPVINRVSSRELSFTGRIAPMFERLDQPGSDVDNSPETPLSKTLQPGVSATSKAIVPQVAQIITDRETAEVDHEFERNVPTPEGKQPVLVAASNSPAPAGGNQPLLTNAISAPTSVPPPLHTESKDRTFQVRLGIEDTDVHLRIAERSGELHLAVSADTAEAAGRLREGLPDLMNALQSTGHSSEFWKASPSSSTSPWEAGEQSFNDDSPSRKQHPYQENGRRRKHRNKDYEPYGVASLA